MSNITINDCKRIVEALSGEFRIAHGSLKLSFPDEPANKVVVPPQRGKGFMVLIVGGFVNDGIDDDVEVARKSLAYVLAQKLGIESTPADFQSLAAPSQSGKRVQE